MRRPETPRYVMAIVLWRARQSAGTHPTGRAPPTDLPMVIGVRQPTATSRATPQTRLACTRLIPTQCPGASAQADAAHELGEARIPTDLIIKGHSNSESQSAIVSRGRSLQPFERGVGLIQARIYPGDHCRSNVAAKSAQLELGDDTQCRVSVAGDRVNDAEKRVEEIYFGGQVDAPLRVGEGFLITPRSRLRQSNRKLTQKRRVIAIECPLGLSDCLFIATRVIGNERADADGRRR